MMDDKKFQSLLDRAAKASENQNRLSNEVVDEIIRRFGHGPGDVDAEEIIDVIDYGGGKLTVAEVEDFMRLALKIKGPSP